MMNYVVIRRDSCDELTDAVNAYINQGWELVGGIAVVGRPDLTGALLWAQSVKRTAPQVNAGD